MKTVGWIFRGLIWILILAGLLLEPAANVGVASPPAQEPQRDGVISSGMTAPAWTRAARPWTEAEMAAAAPYPLPSLDGEPDRLAAAADAVKDLKPVFMPGRPPEGESNLLSAPGLEMFSFTAPTGYTYPAPFTRWTNIKAYDKSYPEKAIGKLYFVQNGVPYVCSAASIGNYAIWTAGHCVHDGSGSPLGWSTNVIFKAGFPGKLKKLGQYTAVNLWTRTEWYYNGDPAADFAGAVLTTYKGKSVSSRVGALGLAWNIGPVQHWFSIGYPAAYPFDGNWQVICASSYAYSDAVFSPAPVGIGCDQTSGTSGGPWILAYGTGYYVNGNMAYRYTSHPLEMFSPYFDGRTADLYYSLIAATP